MAGYSLLDMLNYGFPQEDGFSWVELVSGSFVGRFGNMHVFMPKWLINNYLDFIKAARSLADCNVPVADNPMHKNNMHSIYSE